MTKKRQPTLPKKSRARTPPFSEHEEWSEAKFWAFVRSGLRSTYNKWPPKWQVLNENKRPYTGPNKQQKWEHQCNMCKEWFPQKLVSIDHIIPAGTLNGFEDAPEFMRKLFVGKPKLQKLCKTCHDKKTRDDKLL